MRAITQQRPRKIFAGNQTSQRHLSGCSCVCLVQCVHKWIQRGQNYWVWSCRALGLVAASFLTRRTRQFGQAGKQNGRHLLAISGVASAAMTSVMSVPHQANEPSDGGRKPSNVAPVGVVARQQEARVGDIAGVPHPIHIAKHAATPEFLRGAVAAAINVLLTFPINKAISRQAYEGLSWRESYGTIQREGLLHLYRGLAPPLMQRAAGMGLMYGSYDLYFHQLFFLVHGYEPTVYCSATDMPANESDWRIRAAAGVLAGLTEGCVGTPFERVQTILQHRHYTEIFKNSAEVTSKLLNHGLKEFYRGFPAICVRNAFANAVWFTFRDPVKQVLPATPPWSRGDADVADAQSSGVNPCATGSVVAGDQATADALTVNPSFPDYDPAPSMVLDGAAAASNGASLSASSVQQHHGRHSKHRAWDVFRDFCSGALLGAGISTMFFPLGVVKSVMQLDIGCRHRGLLETGIQIYHDRGIAGLYRGVHANMFRSLLSWGIVNSSYELAKGFFHVQQQQRDHEALQHSLISPPMQQQSFQALQVAQRGAELDGSGSSGDRRGKER